MIDRNQVPERNRSEAEMERASAAFHARPSNPSTYERYQEHFKRPCPCEDYDYKVKTLK